MGSADLVFFDAYWFERYIIAWEEFDISDGVSDKIKTVQLSGLHINAIKSFHKTIAKRINTERPDVLFITGGPVDIRVLNTFL